MSEARLWRTVRDAIGKRGHWDRIESHSATQGRPDVNFCVDGITVDIELKVFDPRRNGFVLRASQNAWITNRTRAGGHVWILARFKEDERECYMLISGSKSRNLIHDRSIEGWKQQATEIWVGMPDWDQAMQIMTGL